MPSPFPGMDPYIEDDVFWSGFHTTMIVAISASITKALPAGYYADVEQHVWLQDEDFDVREPFGYPDAYVAGHSNNGGIVAVATGKPVSVSTEVTLAKIPRKSQQKFVKIVDQPGNRVITVIELLSPSNKHNGPDREQYIVKRNQYLASGTHFVEIDLLRDGDRMPMGRPRPASADYYAIVVRANLFPKASVWAFTVRDTMPILPIPLKLKDGEITLELRDGLDRAYEDGGYQKRIDYQSPPTIQLRRPDQAWADEFLKAKRPK